MPATLIPRLGDVGPIFATDGEFVGSNSGVGDQLQRALGNFERLTLFACPVIPALIGALLFRVIERMEARLDRGDRRRGAASTAA